MPKQTAGLLLHRPGTNGREVFLVHPGGPFWAKKDLAAWSIPKGEFASDEDPLAAAQREFTEETGLVARGPFTPLGTLKLPGGKILHAFAASGDVDPAAIVSNVFSLEWPPRSGRQVEFPEVDRAAWFDLSTAAEKIHRGQLPLLARVAAT
jgi:predicted NUDIX family NTP pyrophosphohydrolase